MKNGHRRVDGKLFVCHFWCFRTRCICFKNADVMPQCDCLHVSIIYRVNVIVSERNVQDILRHNARRKTDEVRFSVTACDKEIDPINLGLRTDLCLILVTVKQSCTGLDRPRGFQEVETPILR